MLKLCMWLNIPSIHQEPLIRALVASGKVDLQVRYFMGGSHLQERSAQGWKAPELAENEQFVDSDESLYAIPEWRERVHIVPGIGHPFCRKLLARIEAEGIKWCHWSERSGITFASKVHFNPLLIRWVLPIVSRIRHASFARKINQSALGAFAIGKLAEDDFISWGVKPEKIRHLYYSCADLPLDLFPQEMQEVKASRSFIYLGSLYHLKGIDVLLKAFASLKDHDCRLILVGKDLSHGQFGELARKLKISDQIEWVGPIASTKVHQWLAKADVLVLPTRFDGWGAVLNEAANAGKALISTNQCGAAWHLIVPGENGFRVQAGSVMQLAQAMDKYLHDSELALQHGSYSQKLYFRDFTASRNAERLIGSIRGWLRC